MPKKLVSELYLICMLALGLCMVLALWSYDAQDPGITFASSHGKVNNWLGLIGAYLASLLFFAFGWIAYLFPLFIIQGAWRGFRQLQSEDQTSFKSLLLPLLAWFVALLSLCALFSFHFFSALPVGAGGAIGQLLQDQLEPYLAVAGSTLLLLTLLLISTSIAYQLSWLAIVDRVGYAVLAILNVIFTWVKPRSGRSNEKTSTKPIKKHHRPLARQHASVEKKPSIWSKVLAVRQLFHWRSSSSGLARKRPEPDFDPLFSNHGSEVEIEDGFYARQPDSTNSEQPASLASTRLSNQESRLTTDTDCDNGIGINQSQPKQLRIEQLRSEQLDDSEFQQQLAQPKLPMLTSLPSVELLTPMQSQADEGYSEDELADMADNLVARLQDFGVKVEIDTVCPGPVITRFEVQPAPGVKASRISGLARDLGRSMAIASVRVVEVIPGKRTVGIEVPNAKRAIVSFKEVLESQAFTKARSPLTLALGHDIAGEAVVADLAKMPHLLVAGTTGSGKSVGVNAMLLSMLFKAGPDELKLMLIDPKMLELSVYEGIPHLLTPVITDMKDAAQGLRWCVAEMERRYKLMSKLGVRNIAGYNQKIIDAEALGQPIYDPLWDPATSLEPNRPPVLTSLPMIVVVVDEFADMIMIVGKKVEELIARIAQKARAAGIHLILATQRPSVDVITGLIKANVPTRIAFQVSSKIDSRTILDQGGAEQLLGHGDMLFMPPGKSAPLRVHGAFVPDEDVHAVVEAWKQLGEPQYIENMFSEKLDDSGMLAGLLDSKGSAEEGDNLYDEAVQIVLESGKPTISYVQRRLKIGYNRAANLIQSMEDAGIISSAGHNGTREILVNNGN